MSQAPEEPDSHAAGGYLAAFDQIFRLHERGMSFSGRERNCAFLNLGDGDFANLSAGSGLDFLDDGRGMAVVDWDHDGDLDLWLANRTAPHLRFLRNDVAGSHSVLLRLRGTRGNRDAIGARVELELTTASGESRLLTRTLRAGEGFLSQSSKWLHFGLGDVGRIERLTVHWPDGSEERIAGLGTAGRYSIIEGSGRAIQQEPRDPLVTLTPSILDSPAGTTPARVVFTARPPVPPLDYRSYAGEAQQVASGNEGPLLLNLWATWCLPCVKELEEFTARAEEIERTGLRLLALSVDGLDAAKVTGPADADRFLIARAFPHASGMASSDLLARLQVLHDRLFSRHIELAVPTSFLFDRQGRLAAIYRGAVELERVLEDVRNLQAPVLLRRLVALPFPGHWLTDPQELRLATLARRFAEDGLPEAAAYYLDLELQSTPDDAALHALLADQLAAAGRKAEAIDEYLRALALDPQLGQARVNLNLLRKAAAPTLSPADAGTVER